MSVARSRLIQRFGRDWMIYALFHCGVEYLISQNSGFWDVASCATIWNDVISIGCLELTRFVRENRDIRPSKTDLAGFRRQYPR